MRTSGECFLAALVLVDRNKVHMADARLKLLESLEEAGVESRRRGMLMAWAALAAATIGAVLLVSYSAHTVAQLRGQRAAEERAVSALRDQRTALEADLAKSNRLYNGLKSEVEPLFPPASALSVETLDRNATLNAVQGARREALQLAFDFYDRKVPFVWGGKTPTDGFDTSGFVAYILAKVGALEHPERFWSGLLRETFKVNARSAADLQPGDLVFEENKACWFVLNDKLVIGMVPPGIIVAETATLGSTVIGYGRVPYDRARKSVS
jgi:hypothetical protein